MQKDVCIVLVDFCIVCSMYVTFFIFNIKQIDSEILLNIYQYLLRINCVHNEIKVSGNKM